MLQAGMDGRVAAWDKKTDWGRGEEDWNTSREIEEERSRDLHVLSISPCQCCLAPLQNQCKILPFHQSSVIGIL